ncbi:MAG: lipoate-protein ligase B, partial [Alphaproteobacteria bacterium HGW-Alphaproteobacteria-12]
MVKPLPLSDEKTETPEWRISDLPVPYDEAVAEMEARVA